MNLLTKVALFLTAQYEKHKHDKLTSLKLSLAVLLVMHQ